MKSSRPASRVCAALLAASAIALASSATANAAQSPDPQWPGTGAVGSEPNAPSTTPKLEAVATAQPLTPHAARRSSALTAAVPETVTGVAARLDSESSVVLSWTAPADGGAAITGYRLEITDGIATYDQEWPFTSTTVRIYDLDPDTTYTVRVAATNAVGTGAYSDSVDFTTPFLYVERQAGQTRFATAARVAERTFAADGVGGAFLVNGLNFPDALAAAAAGGAAGGPVLLTRPTELPFETRDQLDFLRPDVLVVAGGDAAVSPAVESEASAYATSGSHRLADVTRFGTASRVAEMWESSDTVYLANGLTFPDALAGAAAAGANDAPVLLSGPTSLPAETAAALHRLQPSTIVILGGEGAISPAVAQAATQATGVETTAERLAGIDRYGTAIEISRATYPDAGIPVVFVANGLGFADALAGAAAAGHLGGPVLLTAPGAASSALIDEVQRLQPERIVVLGGPAAVSEHVVDQLNATWRPR